MISMGMKKGEIFLYPPFEHGLSDTFDGRQPAETGTHQYPHAFGIFFGNPGNRSPSWPVPPPPWHTG